jgi:exodeoxyribonuclease VII small subunit
VANSLSFEEAFEKLEKIVSQMESDKLKLDDSLKLFEEGVKLTKVCNEKLDEIEKKMKNLLKNLNTPNHLEAQ